MDDRPEGEGWEEVEIEVATDNLCEVYGCERCPGRVTQDGETVPCTHECHLASVDA